MSDGCIVEARRRRRRKHHTGAHAGFLLGLFPWWLVRRGCEEKDREGKDSVRD